MYKNFTVTRVADGIYAAIANEGSKAMSNAGIIDLGNHTIVFDAFLSPEAALELKAAAEELTGRQAAYLVNSHYHVDHTGGNLAFGRDVGIIAGETTRDLIMSKNQEMLAYYLENAEGMLEHFRAEQEKASDTELRKQLQEQLVYANTLTDTAFELVSPQITFTDRLILCGELNSVELVNLYNGHTECDTIAYIRDKGIMFTGDIVFVGRHPWLGAGDPYCLKNLLCELETYDICTLIPGHGAAGGGKDIELMKQYIELLCSIAEDILARNKTLERFDANDLPLPFAAWKGNKLILNIKFLMEKVRLGNL